MLFWEHISENFRQRLLIGCVSAQPVAADLTGIQVHLGAHQSVDPKWIYQPTMAQHPDGSRVIRPPQVNDRAAGTRFWRSSRQRFGNARRRGD